MSRRSNRTKQSTLEFEPNISEDRPKKSKSTSRRNKRQHVEQQYITNLPQTIAIEEKHAPVEQQSQLINNSQQTHLINDIQAAAFGTTQAWNERRQYTYQVLNQLQNVSMDQVIADLESFITRVQGQIDEYRHPLSNYSDHDRRMDEATLRYYRSIVLNGEFLIPFGVLADEFYKESWESD